MRRALDLVARDWPLLLASLLVATVLYVGLVLSQNTRTWPARVPIDAVRPPTTASLLEPLGDVRVIRYRAPVDVASRITNDDFHASVDLSRIQPQAGGPPVQLGVSVVPTDPRVDIVDFEPKTVTVRLDPVLERAFQVTLDTGVRPRDLTIGIPQLRPGSVTVTGPSSRVGIIRRVQARVAIDASGINVDGDVAVVPLDDRGEVVTQVELQPDRVHVQIDVARELASRSVPVLPQLVGAPPPGYRVRSVSSEPLAISVNGEQSVISALPSVSTEPIDLSGETGPFEATVALVPPAEVSARVQQVRVTVEIRPEDGSRTFGAGVALIGARPDLDYRLSASQILVTLAGAVPQLELVTPTELIGTVDVRDLGPGEHDAAPVVRAPAGTSLVSVVPFQLTVSVTQPPTPTPVPSPVPSPSSPPVSPAAHRGGGHAVLRPAWTARRSGTADT